MLTSEVFPPLWQILIPLALVAILYIAFLARRAIKLLDSIDQSLQYLPAVRDARTRIEHRKAA